MLFYIYDKCIELYINYYYLYSFNKQMMLFVLMVFIFQLLKKKERKKNKFKDIFVVDQLKLKIFQISQNMLLMHIMLLLKLDMDLIMLELLERKLLQIVKKEKNQFQDKKNIVMKHFMIDYKQKCLLLRKKENKRKNKTITISTLLYSHITNNKVIKFTKYWCI